MSYGIAKILPKAKKTNQKADNQKLISKIVSEKKIKKNDSKLPPAVRKTAGHKSPALSRNHTVKKFRTQLVSQRLYNPEKISEAGNNNQKVNDSSPSKFRSRNEGFQDSRTGPTSEYYKLEEANMK